MSKYSEYLKETKMSGMKTFFGEDAIMDDNHIYSFHHYVNDEEVRIVTSNVKIIKDSYVLIVDNNKAVFLKNWQVMKIKNWNLLTNTYVVKLNKKFFKSYTFKSNFEEFQFDKEDTFEDFVNLAKEQDNNQITWKLGHYECI